MNMKENWEAIHALRDGEPCKHPGCLSHLSHPCEGCGRIGGKKIILTSNPSPNNYLKELWDKSKDITSEYFAAPTEQINCQTCTDQTKYPIGFWDGEKSHGQIFDCNNQACLVKQENIEKALVIKAKMEEVEKINLDNGIDMKLIKAKRKSLEITINKMALKLRIMCSKYSGYETCREPLPVELRDKIEDIFKEMKSGYMGEILKKYGRNNK